MMNIYFPDEEITDNDLYFICYMIERALCLLELQIIY